MSGLINSATLSFLFIYRDLKSQSVALPDKWHQKGTAKAARRRGHPNHAQREGLRSSERAPRRKWILQYFLGTGIGRKGIKDRRRFVYFKWDRAEHQNHFTRPIETDDDDAHSICLYFAIKFNGQRQIIFYWTSLSPFRLIG